MLYHLFGHPMSPIFGWILTINYNPHHCCARSIYVWCIPKYPRALNTVKGYHSLDLKYVYIVVYLCKNHVHIYIYDINIYCICNQNTLIICHEQKILRRYMNPADDRYCPPGKKKNYLSSEYIKVGSYTTMYHQHSHEISNYWTQLMINCPTVSILQLLTSMMIIIV